MAVTIKDIAQVAGVSHTTVSRALRGNPAIAPETVARIEQIAYELGYVPNTVARGLKTNRSMVLGVIVRRIVDPFFAEVLNGIEDVTHAAGYRLFLASSNRDPDREQEIIRTMSEHRVDGVVLCSTVADGMHRAELERFGVPSVMINNQAQDAVLHSVSNDNAYGARVVTDHLIQLGHERIAYLGNGNAGQATIDRRRGYTDAMQAAGLPIRSEYISKGPNGMAGAGANGMQAFQQLAEPPTAVFCFNDVMAIGAINTLNEMGLSVPDDCSVVGFDNIDLASYVTPSLTTFDQPKYDLGRLGAEMILDLINRKHDGRLPSESSEAVQLLRGQLIERASTAPPAA